MSSGRVFEMAPAEPTIDVDEDILDAFDKWKEGLKDSDAPGSIRAYRVPLDDQGRASHSASGQTRLGSWPVDQYDFDALCDKIIRDYMLPTENIMAVRLIGTIGGKAGVRFNKLVTLQRANQHNLLANPIAQKEGVGEIMRAINESNERMLAMMQNLGGNRGGDGGELMRTVAIMSELNKPFMSMMAPLMSALVGRPPGPAAGSSGSLKETLEAMVLMDRFMGRRGGGGEGSDPAWVKLITSVSGVAKPLLETLAANKQAEVIRTRKALPPTTAAAPAPGSTPTPSGPIPPTAAPGTGAPVTVVVDPAVAAMDRPSQIQTNTFAPTSDPSSPTGGGDMFAEMKRQVDSLVEVAAQNPDPVQVADFFFDQTMMSLDDDSYSKLAGLIEGDGFLGQIAMLNPRVKEFTPFFTALRTQLIKRITEADA